MSSDHLPHAFSLAHVDRFVRMFRSIRDVVEAPIGTQRNDKAKDGDLKFSLVRPAVLESS